MNTTMEVTTKKNYLNPQIEIVMLDNEISLALESPPVGPDESYLSPEFIENNPFRNNNA